MEPEARRWRLAGGMALLFGAYAATAKLGLTFDAMSGVATAVWPPTGLSLVALTIFGVRLWPAITLAAFVVNAQTGAPLAAAAGMAVGNTLEALAGAWLLRRAAFSPTLERVRDASALIVLGALLSTTISATFGATSLALTGALGGASYRDLWWVWWVGDAGGDLVVAPFLFAWIAGGIPRARAGRIVELALLLAALVSSGLLALTEHPRFYLAFPAALWAGLRFGPRGAATSTVILAVSAIVHAAAGGRDNLVELQLFIGVLATTSLLLGAAVAERRRAVLLRDEFLSVASHELRTPLAALKLRVEGVQRMLTKGADAEALGARLAPVNQQIDRLDKLIEELLDVSRITAGRLHLERTTVKLGEVVRAVAAQKGRDIELELDDALSGRWDPLRLEQVVGNLIGNALVHGSPPVRVALRRAGRDAVLIVSDAGPGVRPEDQGRVFERFEQRDARGRAGGLGLGLYITRQIVQAHGGTIEVEGAIFTVRLPLG